jgi:hypothetical protein
MMTLRSAFSRLLFTFALCLVAGFASAQSFYVGLGNGDIQLVQPDGSSTLFGTVSGPEGMIIDSMGNLLVADSSDNVIYRFSPQGSRSIFASGFSGVSDVAMDSTGAIYAADTLGNQILRFAPDGTPLGVYGTGAGGPEALTFDQADALFVASNATSDILEYAPGGGTPSVFASTPTPITLTWNSDFTQLYTGSGGTITTFDRSGNASTYPKTANTIADMTFDEAGNFYVLDASSRTIRKFAPDTSETSFATVSSSSNPTGFVLIPPLRTEVEGTGSIAVSGGEATFQLDVKSNPSGKAKGSFAYADAGAGLVFRATEFSGLTIVGTHAQFSGTARNGKKKISFTVIVNDNNGAVDNFSITTSTGYSTHGSLTSGDIKIR